MPPEESLPFGGVFNIFPAEFSSLQDFLIYWEENSLLSKF
jgi:hypothetical protein